MSPSIDAEPRLRARRVAVRRAAGRRRLKRLAVALAAGLAVTGALLVLHSPLLSARVVQVAGATHERRGVVLAAAGLVGRPPLLDVDPGRAAAALERLPWVATAEVHLRWPDGVLVVVTERRPIAEVPLPGGGTGLLDATGRVLADLARPAPGLARLAPLAAVPPPGGSLRGGAAAVVAAACALPLAVLPRLASIGEEAGGVVLHLTGGTLALLGSPSQLPEKMASLLALLDRAHLGHVSLIDLRVASAPVLTP